MIIVPAPLEQNIDVLIQDINRLSPYFSRFQIDVGDGEFVDNTTTKISKFVNSFANIQNVKNVVFDFHLMVKDPETHIKEVRKLPKDNVGVIFIHKAVFLPEHAGVFGLVLSPEDEVKDLSDECVASLSAIQVMTVYPGFQGKPLLLNMLTKIEQLRKRGFEQEILIDGGINEETLPIVLQQKYVPDVCCVGSFLTKAPIEELQKRILHLKTIIGSKE